MMDVLAIDGTAGKGLGVLTCIVAGDQTKLQFYYFSEHYYLVMSYLLDSLQKLRTL